MGLDSFSSDDDSSKSKTTRTTGGSAEPAPDVGPRFAYQGFGPESEVTARSIKYQIKSFSANWKTQFSSLRFSGGELVLYSAGINTTKHNKTIMVFTTIQSITADESPEEDLDIWVVPWDLEKQDNTDRGTYISYHGDWQEELHETIGKYLESLDLFEEHN